METLFCFLYSSAAFCVIGRTVVEPFITILLPVSLEHAAKTIPERRTAVTAETVFFNSDIHVMNYLQFDLQRECH
jgi:hypothetical protein